MATLRRILILHVLICIFEGNFLSSEGCYIFSKTGNIGELSPDTFNFVQEGSTLHLNCSLYPQFADANNISARDIFWDRKLAGVGLMTLNNETESRVNTKTIDQYTSSLRISNLVMGDDDTGDNGEYGCVVNVNGSTLRICSVEVPVAGPPRKFINFVCVSENYRSLNCTFQRPGPFIGRSTTKYSLSYHVNNSGEMPCPKFHSNVRDGSYWCDWEKEKQGKVPLLEYTHSITINGTNPYGTVQWTEEVVAAEHVRPAHVKQLKADPSNHTSICYLRWEPPIDNPRFLREIGLVYQIDIREKTDDFEDVDFSQHDTWNTVADAVERTNYTLSNLDANTEYTIRVRSRSKKAGAAYSNFALTSCKTPGQVPRGGPGLVTGAYEELGNGGQRRVTLYWKGLPRHLRNGPGFHYDLTVRTLQGGKFVEGSNNNRHTNFANIMILAPSSDTYEVEVTPKNEKGAGLSEKTIIPAVRDEPLLIEFANVVKFQQGVYELSWGVNRPADTIDLFWCQTTLQPHLEKCTDRMEHVNVSGSLSAYNVTLDPRHEYRLAVAARQGDALSGMTWVVKSCSSTDNLRDLDGLTAVQGPKGIANVSWLTPCQKRFLLISGYRIYFYPCEINAPAECTPNNSIDTNATSLSIPHLSPGKRYCFSLFVLDELNLVISQNFSGPLPQKVVQCLKMAPQSPTAKLPMGKIVGGSVGASILLVVIVFVAWRCLKRARKDFRDIKEQSQKIIIPPGLSDKYDDHYRNHYTNIDSEHSGYMRQLSGVSRTSSGHGSISSRESRSSSRASKDGTDTIPRHHHQTINASQSISLSNDATDLSDNRPKHRHSTVDLVQLHQQLSRKKSASPDTISLTSSMASVSSPYKSHKPVPRPRTKPFSNSNTLDRPHSIKPDTVHSNNDSGVVASTGDSQISPSDGYVTDIATIHSKSQSPKQRMLTTSDGGYVSQQSSVSDSVANSGASEGSEDVLKRMRLDVSLSGVSYSSAFEHVSEEQLDEMSAGGLDSGQSSPGVEDATKSYVMPDRRTVTPERKAQPVLIPASGYVAWP